MKPERNNYKLGESVYDTETGFFLGIYVDSLTDDLPGEDDKFKDKLLKDGPIGEYTFSGSLVPYKVYSRRTVFTYRFGTVKQILSKYLDGSLVWFNV